jgi:hypothetical protein
MDSKQTHLSAFDNEPVFTPEHIFVPQVEFRILAVSGY